MNEKIQAIGHAVANTARAVGRGVAAAGRQVGQYYSHSYAATQAAHPNYSRLRVGAVVALKSIPHGLVWVGKNIARWASALWRVTKDRAQWWFTKIKEVGAYIGRKAKPVLEEAGRQARRIRRKAAAYGAAAGREVGRQFRRARRKGAVLAKATGRAIAKGAKTAIKYANPWELHKARKRLVQKWADMSVGDPNVRAHINSDGVRYYTVGDRAYNATAAAANAAAKKARGMAANATVTGLELYGISLLGDALEARARDAFSGGDQ